MPSEWRDVLLVPVRKKGDLSCDNWRGISLLDVMGKLFARVLNDRLQLMVEEAVSDSQCGFRAVSIIMVFCFCQLVEKAIEHSTIRYYCCLLTYTRPMILYPGQPFGVLCGSMVYQMF